MLVSNFSQCQSILANILKYFKWSVSNCVSKNIREAYLSFFRFAQAKKEFIFVSTYMYASMLSSKNCPVIPTAKLVEILKVRFSFLPKNPKRNICNLFLRFCCTGKLAHKSTIVCKVEVLGLNNLWSSLEPPWYFFWLVWLIFVSSVLKPHNPADTDK